MSGFLVLLVYVPLVASGEGFVAAFLFPAMKLGKKILIDVPLDAVFLQNIDKLMAIYHQWWGYSPVTIECPSITKFNEGETGFAGFCFTAGVDSFYSLRTYTTSPITHLINIHGYTIFPLTM